MDITLPPYTTEVFLHLPALLRTCHLLLLHIVYFPLSWRHKELSSWISLPTLALLYFLLVVFAVHIVAPSGTTDDTSSLEDLAQPQYTAEGHHPCGVLYYWYISYLSNVMCLHHKIGWMICLVAQNPPSLKDVLKFSFL